MFNSLILSNRYLSSTQEVKEKWQSPFLKLKVHRYGIFLSFLVAFPYIK